MHFVIPASMKLDAPELKELKKILGDKMNPHNKLSRVYRYSIFQQISLM